MAKAVNEVNIEGIIYQFELAEKEVTDSSKATFGKKYIQGNIDIATDADGLNVVTWYCVYAAEGNRTYSALKDIMTNGKTFILDGPEAATKIKIDKATLSLNDWYDKDDNLVSNQRVSGGFVNIISVLSPKVGAKWKADIIIKRATRIEATETSPERVKIAGAAIDDYRKTILPMEFETENPEAMDYFESLEASESNPIFINMWGKVVSVTERRIKKTASVFGGDDAADVDYSERKVKKLLITGCAEPYEEGSEFLTPEEFTQFVQNRNLQLAEQKRQRDEYKAKKAASTPAPAASVPTAGPSAAAPTRKFTF